MEIRVNKEIRSYSETVFFGLSFRQFLFSVLACVMAVLLYFLLRPVLGLETVSWVCILGAAPFAALGFVSYNGMSAEKFLLAVIKSELLMPKRLLYLPVNLYYTALRGTIASKAKEGLRNEDTKPDCEAECAEVQRARKRTGRHSHKNRVGGRHLSGREE